MIHSGLQPFDFRKHAALGDTAVSLRNWVAKSSSFFSDFWAKASDYDAQLSAGTMETHSYADVLENVCRDDLCCLAQIEGQSRTVWYASNSDFRLICNEMLGLASDADNDRDDNGADNDRENKDAGEDDHGADSDPEKDNADLSAVEFTLIKMFLENLADSLGRGWMGAPKVSFQLGNLGKDPRKVSAFRGSDLLTVTSIEIQLKSGNASINWLLPKQQTVDLLATVIDRRKKSEPASCSPAVVGKVPIELVIELGSVNVPMMELSNLAAGKLITLDQRMDRPLVAYVDNAPFCDCWPGRVGNQQALEVSRLHQVAATGESNE